MSIEEFETLMQEYNEAFEAADGQKEQDAVNEKFAAMIDSAEEELEAAFEAEIKAADEALVKEQKAAELPEDKPQEAIDVYDPKAGEPMRSDVLELSKSEFADKYRVIDIRTLAKALGITGYTRLREAELIDAVYKAVESEAKI